MPNFVETQNHDPHLNLAAEEKLFNDALERGGATLFLWRNSSTVVVGKNQNALRECRVSLLEAEGGVLSRRLSGGGAVYHDLGNLCFTFVAPDELYDVRRQTELLARAAAQFGLAAEMTGRNDVVVTLPDGARAKFSGNAYRSSGGVSMQHGTVLIGVDMGKLGRYLSPSEAKLRGNGVESVRSRVQNLSALSPDITPESFSRALKTSFAREYGEPAILDDFVSRDNPELSALYEKYASFDFRFGNTPQFDMELTGRFSFGLLTLALKVEHGVIATVSAWSDSLDTDLIDSLPRVLTGVQMLPHTMAKAAPTHELAEWLGNII